MATEATARTSDDIDYPDGDGRPMAETPVHRQNLTDLIAMLEAHFDADPMVYVSGNMFVYYERGNRYRCLAPDVFLARGVDKNRPRGVFKTWEEDHGLDLVIELTSPSTKEEDLEDKYALYAEKLHVREYFLFDPLDEYLEPPLQGYRLIRGEYVAIEPVEGRLPSEVVGLHLVRDGSKLRFYDPAKGSWLPTPREAWVQSEQARDQAQRVRDQAQQARDQAQRARDQAQQARDQAQRDRDQAQRERDQEGLRREHAEAELRELRRVLEALRRGDAAADLGDPAGGE